MTVTPLRSPQQRRQALDLANHIRCYRAVLKVEIKQGRVQVGGLLADPPSEILTMRVFDLLLAMPMVGQVKANNAFRASRTAVSKTVEGLTPRQRAEIVRFVTPRFRGVHAERERRAA